ncbi:MAG TPA: ABC transporter ATP-binding protein [Anaerolineae bacterium]|nr:ABC transporter ATP-binding protein [Anaerolineae bacterium]
MARLAIYGRLMRYLQPYWLQIVLAYAAMFFATLLNILIPQLLRGAVDRGLEQKDATVLFMAAGAILAVAVVRGVAGFFQRYFGEWLSYRAAYDLRNDFYTSLQGLSFAFHDQAHTGDLMSRATGDITETERFVGIGLMELLASVLLMIGVVTAMLLMDLRLALLALIPLPLLLVSTVRFGMAVRPRSRHVQDQLGVLSTTMQESLTGIGVVKAFAREPYEFEKFDRDNSIWFRLREGLIRLWGNSWPFFTFLIAMSNFLLLLFGGPMVLNGQITVGVLFAMITYVLMLNGPAQRLGFLVNAAATADASASRVFEIMDTPNTVAERPDARPLTQPRGQVVFEEVSFGYRDGLNVLQDICFSAQPGQVIALMGPTGSGKSSIINLIPRFYDPVAGRVLVDGVDVRELTLDSLRGQIGIVLQEPFLFSASIAENIAYGRPNASQAEIERAARAANAHDFIVGFPAGYATRVGERGVTLSGGQKQRVAIARALLYDARILILDDSTSSVDTETEFIIQQALQTLMQGRTTFVIAQRLLTLKHADQILVLEHGRIVQRGRHEALLAEDGLYRQIYDLQLRDQEQFLASEG